MDFNIENEKSVIFVISAPSGVGKTTIRKILMSQIENLTYSVSMTTRGPRNGEIEGVDYYFVSHEDFQEKIKNHLLLEWAKVHENFYGTPKKPIIESLKNQKDVLLDVDVNGAHTLQTKLKGAIFIFLLPPSWRVLEDRLRNRQTESEQEVINRLKTAKEEINYCHKYDYLIINNKLEETADKIKAVMLAEHCRLARMQSYLQEICKEGNDICFCQSHPR